MRAGRLRHKIDILELKEVVDDAGGISKEWVPIHNGVGVRCEDIVKSTNQKLASGVDLQEEIHTIMLRYRGDITGAMRVRLSDGRELSIIGRPTPDEKRRSLIITAEYNGN